MTGGTHASFAAAKVTTTIPIVFVGVAGPLEAGLVTSLARPGGNITGLSFDVTPETVAKRLELFKEVAPKAARLGHLVNPNNPFFSLYIRSVEIGAQAFRVELQRVEVRAPEDFDGWSSRQRIGCLRCTARASSWRLAGCSPTLQTFQKCSLARRATSTGSSRARRRAISPSSSRGNREVARADHRSRYFSAPITSSSDQEDPYCAMEGETKDRPTRASLRQGSRSDASSDLRT